ncbi:MAG: DMT family transporter [Geminicoccaceae bacterium]
MAVRGSQLPGAAMQEESGAAWAYAALLAAMLISSGNFMFGNLAVREIAPWTLTFWRTAIALACVVPFALQGHHDLAGYFRRQKVKVLVLSVTGVILPAWLMYLSLRSHLLIDLSVGYTLIPLMAVLFSALLLGERLLVIQYLGLAAAFLGALACAFEGELSNLARFDPHAGFVWMMAVCLTRSLYLVLLRKWDMHPSPGEGLFVLLALGVAILVPGFVGEEVASRAPLDYPWQVWGSIAFIGVGMGALYLHLISFGTGRIGATKASLFTYTVPLLVTVESILFLGSRIHAYQIVAALLVVGGVFIVSWFRSLEPHPSEVHH